MRKLLIMIVLFASGCQTPVARDETSPLFVVPVGSTLTLHRPLRIPPNDAGVYIQYGRVLAYNQVDAYYAHCDFEVRTRRAVAQTVRPDTFGITRVVQDTSLVDSGTKQLAAGAKFRPYGDIAHLVYATEMYLRSASQPDVLRLTCAHREPPEEGDHLSIAQIRQALGELMSLQIR
jgi:hypothetical protein